MNDFAMNNDSSASDSTTPNAFNALVLDLGKNLRVLEEVVFLDWSQ